MTDLSPLLEVAPNFRDIAAHAPLARGLAYRSSELVGLSARAQSVLRSLGVTTVYDLRTQAERTPLPDSLPEPIQLVIADVLADAPSSGAAALAALGSGSQQVDIAAVNDAISGGRARDLMIDSYRDFIRLPSANKAYALFLRGVATTQGSLAFHCTAGKDRTGWAAALLQTLAGVDRDTIMEDYLRSNDLVSTKFGPLVDAFGAAGGDAAALRQIIEVDPAYLQVAFDTLAATYSSFDAYLRAGLGLEDDEVSAIRERLTAR